MARKDFKVDIKGLDEFLKKLKVASGKELQVNYKLWLEAVGMEFLGIVQDEIIRLKVVDTRRLLNSFSRSGSDCVFRMTNNGLALEIGTNVDYAVYVNDGHKLRGGGWWEGYHYFDISLEIFEKILAVSLEKKLQEWLDTF